MGNTQSTPTPVKPAPATTQSNAPEPCHEKLHNPRFFNLAVVDFTLTVVVALIIAGIIVGAGGALSYGVTFFIVLICLFLLAIFLHWWFKQPTFFNYWLYISGKPVRYQESPDVISYIPSTKTQPSSGI